MEDRKTTNLHCIFSPQRAAHTQAFLTCEADIRERLGDNAWLLDRWLERVLLDMNGMDTLEAAAAGFDAGRELGSLVASIVKDTGEYMDHPFFHTALEFIQKHPLLSMGKECRVAVYHLALFDAWSSHCLREAGNTLAAQLQADSEFESSEEELRCELQILLGDDETMDSLLQHFVESQSVSPSLPIYAQGMANYRQYLMVKVFAGERATVLRMWLDSGIGIL